MVKRTASTKYTVTTESSVQAGFWGGKARWTVDVAPDDYHVIDFEHTGILGKRIVKIDDRVVIKRNKSLKLVGRESFTFGGTTRHHGEITIEPVGFSHYEYTLYIDSAPFAEFVDFARAQAQNNLLGVSSHTPANKSASSSSRMFGNPNYDVSTPL
ncbi:hypothetical protein PTSG_10732 [Salpingoeca rosetta]|uniref:Uncharacterized protein n=1 Tax=Salpingoeca rosetta (strain ATCC 50818 / BSB-021) TaxID=946362 RepID=F2UQ80_SALR5|nr:uncharacterized protein PTSG_10732 [Salpingoeca rosetta]EGD79748.1 hypothetical protein PTSG_10732 [Salpingoeca rosetta]|eukprot:XP_004988697.1 hypothetical protein PTSG_10732 [Salpingoeca rosetta]